MIDINKKYRTRDGRPVELITTSGRGYFQVIGYVAESTYVYYWSGDGKSPGADSNLDLVPVSEFDNVPVDTPVNISNNGVHWVPAHFAKVDEFGNVYVFVGGRTSHTADSEKQVISYKYVVLLNK